MWESSPSDAGLYGVTGRASISWQRGGRYQAGRWVYLYLAPMSAASASWQTRASPTQTTGILLFLPCHCRLRHGYRCDTLYHSIGAMFFFIGTALFAFYQPQPDILPTGIKPDAVFPHFIMTQLPVGLTGLVLAAICAAAMDSNLTCSATLLHCDIYERYFRRSKSERESLWVLRLSTLAFGIVSIITALAMISVKNALDVWWKYAGIFSGGMVGLFLLGLISRRANNAGAIAGTAIGILA